MEDRGKPDLTIDNVLLIPVLHRLICHASEGLLCLHHGSGHGKSLKIQGKALELAALLEPCAKLYGILRWNGDIIFPCQINHCRRSETSVQMIVKLHLGNSLNDVVWNHGNLRGISLLSIINQHFQLVKIVYYIYQP